MCGIVGIFNPHGLNEGNRDLDVFKRMLFSLHHRGPDDKGIFASNCALLGHARLSIIDLETGQQPMVSFNNRFYITFNGEIFNYLELKEGLLKKGYKFKTKSDTEVLVNLFQEYGPSMLEKLNGQFAFAIFDKEKKKVFIARDRIGIIPLFYTLLDETLIFASTIKSILNHPKVERCFNNKAYKQLMLLWTTYGDSTFFKGIYSLPPGEFIEYSSDGLNKEVYWDINFPKESDIKPISMWQEEVSQSLNEAVRIRLRADVPVNAYLSGGLDSSILLTLLKENKDWGLESYSVRFLDKDYDETYFQKLIIDSTGIKNNNVLISPQMIGEVFEDIIWQSEQPVYRTAPAPLLYLSKMVNNSGNKVVLTGEGADEIAWGYHIFKETLLRCNLINDPENEEWLSKIEGLYPYLKQFNKRYINILKQFYQKSLDNPNSPLFSHDIRMNNGRYVLNFLKPGFKEIISSIDITESIISTLPHAYNTWTPLQKTQYLEMKTLLSGYLLSSQGDRMLMANSVEGRFPFLDHNVIELFSLMPDDIKLKVMNEKYILKETFKNSLPKEIIERDKQPYRAPEGLCLLSDYIKEKHLNKKSVEKLGFFEWEYVEKLKNKIEHTGSTHFNFNDNFAFVNIISTQIFAHKFIESFEKCEPSFVEKFPCQKVLEVIK